MPPRHANGWRTGCGGMLDGLAETCFAGTAVPAGVVIGAQGQVVGVWDLAYNSLHEQCGSW